MPARAHRRAPDHLAGAVPNPPMQGACSIRPPHQSPRSLAPPGRWPPSTPPSPPSRSANWRIRKIAISSAPSRGPLHRPPWGRGPAPKPPPPLLKRKVPPPCVHPGPRASRAGFASPPLHLPSTPPAGAANSPAAPTGAPRPPFPGPRSTAGRPRPGLGGGDRRWRMVTWGPACRGGRTARVTLPGPPP
ncbi:hypothetical protein N7530_012962 [Penicillium desertorum]|uniref:Uncharacterized protein n=1 Tax=Penicillium desertorum TaxID=1303715 RepID=A0A9W9WDD3_9EURO|nr:hypothetical protein N7530_012962 [Penicillium desertorum]